MREEDARVELDVTYVRYSSYFLKCTIGTGTGTYGTGKECLTELTKKRTLISIH